MKKKEIYSKFYELLTPKQKRVFDCMVSPQGRKLRGVEIAKRAGVHPNLVSKVKNLPGFLDEVKEKAAQMIGGPMILEVIKVFLEEAIENKSYQHGKILLDMMLKRKEKEHKKNCGQIILKGFLSRKDQNSSDKEKKRG